MNTFAVVSRTKKRVHADDCDSKTEAKFSKGHFACIDCGNDVFIRRGSKRAWHFAHFREEDAKKCPHANGGETKEHYDAKHFISRSIDRCAFATEKCPSCNRKKFFVGRSGGAPIFVHHCSAEVERGIPGTRRVADVAAIHPDTGRWVAAIEVLHTHETDADKRKECASQGIPVLEVRTSEVQRVQRLSLRDQHALLQMRTTDMQRVECVECVLHRAWMSETEAVASNERWHAGVWGGQHPLDNAVLQILASLQAHQVESRQLTDLEEHWIHEHNTAIDFETWYTRMWTLFWRNNELEQKYHALSRERKDLIMKGMDAARAQMAKSAARARFYKGRSCITKCKACQKWVFDDDPGDVCEVQACTMPAGEWCDMFDGDPPKYRKRYRLPDGEFNFIYVHSECSVGCPSCDDSCIANKLATYGICYSCNSFYNKELNGIKKRMRK